jgi:hypothetical protein
MDASVALTGDTDLILGGIGWTYPDLGGPYGASGFASVYSPQMLPNDSIYFASEQGWYMQDGIFDAHEFTADLYLTIGNDWTDFFKTPSEDMLIVDGQGDDHFAMTTYGWNHEKTLELSSGGMDTVYFQRDYFWNPEFASDENFELNDINLITDFSVSGDSQDKLLVDVYDFGLGNANSNVPGLEDYWLDWDAISDDLEDGCNDIHDGLQLVALNPYEYYAGDDVEIDGGNDYNFIKFMDEADPSKIAGGISDMDDFFNAIMSGGDINVEDDWTDLLGAGYLVSDASADGGYMILFRIDSESTEKINIYTAELNPYAKVEMTLEEYQNSDLVDLIGFYSSDTQANWYA